MAGGIPITGCWMTFVCDVDAYIVFGKSNVGAASAANGWPIAANVVEQWYVLEVKDAFFRIIRKGTTDGVLKRYRSNL